MLRQYLAAGAQGDAAPSCESSIARHQGRGFRPAGVKPREPSVTPREPSVKPREPSVTPREPSVSPKRAEFKLRWTA